MRASISCSISVFTDLKECQKSDILHKKGQSKSVNFSIALSIYLLYTLGVSLTDS